MCTQWEARCYILTVAPTRNSNYVDFRNIIIIDPEGENRCWKMLEGQ